MREKCVRVNRVKRALYMINQNVNIPFVWKDEITIKFKIEKEMAELINR